MSLFSLKSYLRFLPRFLPTQCRLCIVVTGFFIGQNPPAVTEEIQDSRQERQCGDHAGGRANRHHRSQTGDSLVLGQDQTAEANDRCQRRHEDGFARALREDAGGPFLGIAIQDVNATGDSDTDDQRQGHDVRRIERNVKPAHVTDHPNRADADGQQRQNHARDGTEVNENQEHYRRQRIPGSLHVAVFQQRRVIIELNRGSRNVGIDGLQLLDEFVLFIALPYVLLGINLQQIEFARLAHETMSQRGRQIFSAQRTAIVLVFQRLKRFLNIFKQRLLKRRDLDGGLLPVLRHSLPELHDGLTQRL